MVDNNILAALVVVSIVISLGGIILISSIPGQAGMATGTLGLQIGDEIIISLPVSDISFGTVALDSVEDTADDNPRPFMVRNDGSVDVDVTVLATDLFSSALRIPSDYQFQCGGTPEVLLCPAGSPLIWMDMPIEGMTLPILAIKSLPFSDSGDELEVEIRIHVPADEGSGIKSSLVTLTASQAL